MRLDSAFVLALLILIVKQTNYMLYIHYTVYCKQYTMYHNYYFSFCFYYPGDSVCHGAWAWRLWAGGKNSTQWLFVDTFNKFDPLNLKIIIKFIGFGIWYVFEGKSDWFTMIFANRNLSYHNLLRYLLSVYTFQNMFKNHIFSSRSNIWH